MKKLIFALVVLLSLLFGAVLIGIVVGVLFPQEIAAISGFVAGTLWGIVVSSNAINYNDTHGIF